MTVMGKGDVPNVMLYEATEGLTGSAFEAGEAGHRIEPQVFAAGV